MVFTNHSLAMAVTLFTVIYAAFIHGVRSDFDAPAPAPANNGAMIDQGIACILMLLALVITYIIH